MTPGVNFDRIASRYDDTRGGVERGAEFAAVLAPHLPDGLILEIGVGTGLVGRAMPHRVVGVDISEAMLAVARHRGDGLALARADAAALPFSDRSFAGAYAAWVLHLVADRVAVLREVMRVVHRPGSFVVEPTARFLPDDPVQQILDPLYASFGPPKDTLDVLTADATTAGWRVADVHRWTSTVEHSPADLAAGIEARSGAAFWDLDADEWARIVEPALRALRGLPDADVRLMREQVHTTIVLDSS